MNRNLSPKSVHQVVSVSVYETVARAVSRAVWQPVLLAVSRAVARAVVDSVNDAVYWAVHTSPSHPNLDRFLAEIRHTRGSVE